MADTAAPQPADPTQPATQPLDVKKFISEAEAVANDAVQAVVGADGKTPEPAVVRGLIVAAAGLVGAIVGKTFDLSWVDQAVELYAAVAPVGLAFWIRLHVTPVPK
jgi:hypothetical protein